MAQTFKIKTLLTSINIGKVTIYGGKDGDIPERQKNFLVRRAKGGVGLITIGDVAAVPNSQVGPNHNAIWDDKFIEGWKDLSAAIHDCGSRLSIQLAHVGSEGRQAVTGIMPVAPSALVSP
jgi:2,4-dienoyl-CoA reductase-like NADH-dependent reductase (Old Yellow Enzyme family)